MNFANTTFPLRSHSSSASSSASSRQLSGSAASLQPKSTQVYNQQKYASLQPGFFVLMGHRSITLFIFHLLPIFATFFFPVGGKKKFSTIRRTLHSKTLDWLVVGRQQLCRRVRLLAALRTTPVRPTCKYLIITRTKLYRMKSLKQYFNKTFD